MDYFDSNFKENQFDHHDELPEDLAWDSMKDGIYNKMEKAKPTKPRRRWPLFLLLFLAGSGSGSWMASKYFTNEANNAIGVETTKVKKTNDPLNTDVKDVASIKANEFVKQLQDDNINTNKPTLKSKPTEKVTSINKIFNNASTTNINQSKTLQPSIAIPYITQIENNKSNTIVLSEEIVTNNLTESNLSFVNTWDKLEGLSTLSLTQFESTTSKEYSSSIKKVSKPTINERKYLEFSLAGGVMNWAAFDADNINHDFVSGYPGYSFSPSLSLFIKPSHAIQFDYEYAAVEELFDYEGSHAIEVSKENEVVKEVVNSLTGEVVSTERRDILVSGERSYKEVKYNKYKLHTISVGYRMTKNISEKSLLGFYGGASYLLNINANGKRLDENLDVIPFDNENPIFQKNQLGLRLGFSYDYRIKDNTSLFSQLIATKYFTNWEMETSKSKTRPLLYGLQIGIRQRLQR